MRSIPVEDEDGHLLSWAELRRIYIDVVLRENDGNKTAAARVLGMDRRTLYRELERKRRVLPSIAGVVKSNHQKPWTKYKRKKRHA